MRLDQEAEVKEQSLQRAKQIDDLKTLERVIRDGANAFERAVDELPDDERDDVRRLYLNKIRRLTFSFHWTLLRRRAQTTIRVVPTLTRDLIEDHADRFDGQLRSLARLYRYIV